MHNKIILHVYVHNKIILHVYMHNKIIWHVYMHNKIILHVYMHNKIILHVYVHNKIIWHVYMHNKIIWHVYMHNKIILHVLYMHNNIILHVLYMHNNISNNYTNHYRDMNDTSRDISSWKCRNVLFWQIRQETSTECINLTKCNKNMKLMKLYFICGHKKQVSLSCVILFVFYWTFCLFSLITWFRGTSHFTVKQTVNKFKSNNV